MLSFWKPDSHGSNNDTVSMQNLIKIQRLYFVFLA